MLYIKDKGQIYLIDRDNSVFNSPNITFLSRKREGEHLRDCVADSVILLIILSSPTGVAFLSFEDSIIHGH